MKKFLTITLIFITNIVFADVGMIVNKLKPYFPEIKAENISTSLSWMDTMKWFLQTLALMYFTFLWMEDMYFKAQSLI